MNQENKKSNHLINEKSPYLLQHAYNPVDWYPWGNEAFERAKSEDKPIFLSIGYSTCHWCHVMERESFEDTEVAEQLNANFISIKVDKEERPDVDNIYMTVCQALNGHGGWPLTIIMTPDQKPFFAGTYLPKQSTNQMLGLMQVLTKIPELWKNERDKLLESSEQITSMLQHSMKQQEDDIALDRRIFGTAFLQFKKQFDEVNGGFGEAPKFPSPQNLMFLLRYAVIYDDKAALNMVEKTLEGMFRGGIYDHIGGGFSRYSTDECWLVPHFEKMLYDNAMLIITYAETYQVTKNPLYEKVIRETLQYIMAEMMDEEGGFYCAQDADSEGEEGKYYVFTPEEVISVLGEEDGEWFNSEYGVTEAGNFEGASIPNLIDADAILTKEVLSKKLREKLYEYRKNRMQLHKDDKILTSWNSLMITAFAKAYQALGDPNYLEVARKAYSFISQSMRGDERRLYVRYREGHRYGLGNLEDYSFFIMAGLMMYESTFEPSYLMEAVKDADDMIRLFWDKENGGFYFYGEDGEDLILRPKEVYDGAMPSGNSVAAYVLAKLEKITRSDEYWDISEKQFQFLCREISAYPSAYAFSLCAMMMKLLDSSEIVCVIKDGVDLDELKQLVRQYFLPNIVIIPIEEYSADTLALVASYTKEYNRVVEESVFHICDNINCLPAFSGMEKLKHYFEHVYDKR